jgi:hypothetical protein
MAKFFFAICTNIVYDIRSGYRKLTSGLVTVYVRYMCLTNYGASEAVNLCNRYVEKSTKYSEQKYACYFREKNQL